MRTTYYDEDDILLIPLSDKAICREVLQDWNTHISYAEDGSTVPDLHWLWSLSKPARSRCSGNRADFT